MEKTMEVNNKYWEMETRGIWRLRNWDEDENGDEDDEAVDGDGDECSENVEMSQDGVADCPDHHQHHQPQQEQQLAPGHSAL